MPGAASDATQIDQSELPGMLATLCWYEQWLGPCHPQTLHLTAQIAFAYLDAGQVTRARSFLAKVIRDAERSFGRDYEIRLRALSTLRDLCVLQNDFAGAAPFQKELLECYSERLGSDHPQTIAARSNLETILLESAACDSARQV